jgi:hypothetical protein
MHNLYFVTIRERCRGPIGAPDYPLIHLNREPLGLQPQLANQVGHGQTFGHFFLLSVYDYQQ